MGSELLRVDQYTHGPAAVVRAVGEIDVTTVGMLNQHLTRAVQTVTPSGPVAVDLLAVDFIASAGMAALIDAHQRCAQLGRFLRVVANPGMTRRLTLVGLHQILTLRPTISDALHGDDQPDHQPDDRTDDQPDPTL